MTTHSTPFHGWRVALTTTFTQFIAVGSTSYAFGLFIAPIATEFDQPRTVITYGIMAFMLASTIASPIVGNWLDKGSTRKAMTIAGFSMPAGVALVGFSSELWMMLLALVAIIAPSFVVLGNIGSSKLITHWFEKLRGKALGISAVGASLGGLLLQPMLATAITEIGWRGALFFLAVFILVTVAPLVRLFIYDHPADIGQTIDGEATNDTSDPREQLEPAKLDFASLISNPNFWCIGLAMGLLSAIVTTLITHFYGYAPELDLSVTQASSFLAIFAGSAIVGKLIYGALADKFNLKYLFMSVPLLATPLWWLMIGQTNLTMLWIIGLLLGTVYGGMLPLWNAIVARCFDISLFARVLGIMGIIMIMILFPAIPIGTIYYDQTGSYLPVFNLALWLLPVAALFIMFVRIPKETTE